MGEHLTPSAPALASHPRSSSFFVPQQSCNICYAAATPGRSPGGARGLVWTAALCNTTHHFYCLSAVGKQQQQPRMDDVY